MTPYWQSSCGRYTLYHGDCLEVLPTLEAGSVDAVVTDPPYGIGFKYSSHDDSREFYEDWCVRWFAALPEAPKLISCGHANVGMWHCLCRYDWMMAWHKPAAMGRCWVGFNNWEPVLVWGRLPRQCADVFTAQILPDPSLDGHPCPKPIAWGVECVARASDEGKTILDPFLGSGTTGVACVKTNRRFIGVEIDERYCEIAAKRIEREAAHLFAEVG